MIYGYARVSTKGQARDGNSLESQTKALKSMGAKKVFSDAYTGTTKDRPQLSKMLDGLKDGDMVVVTKLDRIARNTKDGIEIIDSILNKGCNIHILNMGLFDDTPTGRLMKNILLAFAEFERDMIVERTREGKEVARANNPKWKEGRPSLNVDNFERYYNDWKNGKITITEGIKELNISRSSWYKLANKIKQC